MQQLCVEPSSATVVMFQSIAEQFCKKFAAAVEQLQAGLPWQSGVSITPLPENNKTTYMHELLEDANEKGALILNSNGGKTNGYLMYPAVVYPVTSTMRLWREEQFGPVVPIACWSEASEVIEWLQQSPYGQQGAPLGHHLGSSSSVAHHPRWSAHSNPKLLLAHLLHARKQNKTPGHCLRRTPRGGGGSEAPKSLRT